MGFKSFACIFPDWAFAGDELTATRRADLHIATWNVQLCPTNAAVFAVLPHMIFGSHFVSVGNPRDSSAVGQVPQCLRVHDLGWPRAHHLSAPELDPSLSFQSL